jgi:hypothetical protein
MRPLLLMLVAAAASAFLVAGSTGATVRPDVGTHDSPGAASFRLLYASDWSGAGQVYAVDAATGRFGQLTFGRAPTCAPAGCGYGGAVPSPNGRFVLYTDFAACSFSSSRSSLFVALADGTHARVVARARASSDCPRGIEGTWAPDSERIAYADEAVIHIVDRDGSRNRVVGSGDTVRWSSDGRAIAFSTHEPSGAVGPLSIRRNERTRLLAPAASAFEWSPDGRWIAYEVSVAGRQGTVQIVHSDGSGRRTLTSGSLIPPGWSPDSRFLSVSTEQGATTLDIGTGAKRLLPMLATPIAWRPQGHTLTVSDRHGTSSLDPVDGAERLLTSEQAAIGRWSPDGRYLAYLTPARYLGVYANSDLRVLTPAGDSRTLVAADGAYGGDVAADFAWTQVSKGDRYRPPQPRSLATVRDDDLTAPWPITRLAADGARVAYTSCGHVFVWTPATREVVQAEPNSSLGVRCTTPGNYWAFSLFTLALSGDRIAFGQLDGNTGQQWGLYEGSVDDGASFTLLAGVASVNGCQVGPGGLGDLTGAGDLLVFSTWSDNLACPARTLAQQVHKVGSGGCPCPVIASAQGPLVPFDVDAGRLVAGGETSTVVLDDAGKQLLSVPVLPLAAQLSGTDLVILEQGHLADFDARTGERLHAWPLPDVPSGGECASPHTGTWECRRARLLLEDAARGLATYVLDGQVHLIRLADGADVTIAAGTLARFIDAGLVYAEGVNLHLIPFDQLPLRTSAKR